MWANEEVVALAEWLRRHNDGRPDDEKVGFYGLDVYSLWESLYAVMGYLQRVDPAAPAGRPAGLPLLRALRRGRPGVRPGHAARARLVRGRGRSTCCRSCAARRPSYRADGREAHFAAEQNALVRQERRGLLPGDGRAAARSRGTSATGTWPRRSSG